MVGCVAAAPQGDAAEGVVRGKSSARATDGALRDLAAAASCSSKGLEKEQFPACCCRPPSPCEAGRMTRTSS